MLRGRRPSYRESLLSVRDRLKVLQCALPPTCMCCMSCQSWYVSRGCPLLIAHTAAAGQCKYWYAPSGSQVQCPSTLATQDLEAEVFLHMMRMWTESKAAASQQEADALMNAYAVAGDKKAPPR